MQCTNTAKRHLSHQNTYKWTKRGHQRRKKAGGKCRDMGCTLVPAWIFYGEERRRSLQVSIPEPHLVCGAEKRRPKGKGHETLQPDLTLAHRRCRPGSWDAAAQLHSDSKRRWSERGSEESQHDLTLAETEKEKVGCMLISQPTTSTVWYTSIQDWPQSSRQSPWGKPKLERCKHKRFAWFYSSRKK